MPVHKYRSASEMPPPGRCGDQELSVRIRAAWRRAFLLSPPALRPGVRRYRTIEEANQDRLREAAQRMRARRGAG
jgi:hypothetical protein